jgi:hypothetical protein
MVMPHFDPALSFPTMELSDVIVAVTLEVIQGHHPRESMMGASGYLLDLGEAMAIYDHLLNLI